MLEITIPGREFYDEQVEEFKFTDDTSLRLEHSLLSISKWESKWHKPFLSMEQKTNSEMIDYVRCMTINKGVDQMVYSGLTAKAIDDINDYIADPMTATWFSNHDGRPSREIITSEVIYYWMIALGIPFECQKWHLNRLLTLIRVCNLKNSPPKKMGRNEIYNQNRSLNAMRRSKMGSSG